PWSSRRTHAVDLGGAGGDSRIRVHRADAGAGEQGAGRRPRGERLSARSGRGGRDDRGVGGGHAAGDAARPPDLRVWIRRLGGAGRAGVLQASAAVDGTDGGGG